VSVYPGFERRYPFKLYLALHVLSSIVPRILDDSVLITERVALAQTWYLFLCKIGLCPEVPEDFSAWGPSELQEIAKSLVTYSHMLISEETRPPELPRRSLQRPNY
jgi:hypothetical protein